MVAAGMVLPDANFAKALFRTGLCANRSGWLGAGTSLRAFRHLRLSLTQASNHRRAADTLSFRSITYGKARMGKPLHQRGGSLETGHRRLA